MQSYSQRIYIQQSNWFIFDHFGHYFQIIFNLYSYCTKFNSIHNNYNILINKYCTKFKLVIFDHFGHYFQIIFNLYSYCTKFNSIHINYNILSILLTNFNLIYLTSAKLFTKNLYTAVKLVHF